MENVKYFFAAVGAYDFTGVLLVVLLCFFAYILYRLNKANHDNKFFENIMVDEYGKPSPSRLAQLIALVVSTWAFIHLTLNLELTEWFFGLYMSIWALNMSFTEWIEMKRSTSRDSTFRIQNGQSKEHTISKSSRDTYDSRDPEDGNH